MFEGENKRIKKEEECQNYLVLMELRRGMEENIFPLISNWKLAIIAWKTLKDSYGCDEDTHEYVCNNLRYYMRKEEPCYFEDPFGDSYEDSCYFYGDICSYYVDPYMFGDSYG